MRKVKLIIMLVGLMAIGFGGNALAYHDGSVAHCDGCHTMHNFADNPAREGVTPVVGGALLKGQDPSSVCLGCHQGSSSYHIMSDDTGQGDAMKPGGDFYWLKRTFTWSAHGNTQTSEGDNHGHNIISADFGLTVDATNSQAPGGTFPSASLGCSSCHDPHGKKRDASGNPVGLIAGSGSYGDDPSALADGETYGNFRLLGDNGYEPRGPGLGAFTYGSPIATSMNSNETNTNHASYGRGMSQWCANCHIDYLTGNGVYMHPATSHLGSTIANVYNNYVKTGDTSGSGWTSGGPYEALVPFQRETDDPTALMTDDTSGPDSGDTVMCLSCHRAHASAFSNAGRWDFTTEFPAEAHPDGGVTDDSTALEMTNSYYGRDIATEFGEHQRPFCNKCHLQD